MDPAILNLPHYEWWLCGEREPWPLGQTHHEFCLRTYRCSGWQALEDTGGLPLPVRPSIPSLRAEGIREACLPSHMFVEWRFPHDELGKTTEMIMADAPQISLFLSRFSRYFWANISPFAVYHWYNFLRLLMIVF